MLCARHGHIEGRQHHVDFSPEVVDPVKAALSPRIERSNVETVVGKLLAWSESRALADDFIALDDELGAISMGDDPLPAQQRHGVVGSVAD